MSNDYVYIVEYQYCSGSGRAGVFDSFEAARKHVNQCIIRDSERDREGRINLNTFRAIYTVTVEKIIRGQ